MTYSEIPDSSAAIEIVAHSDLIFGYSSVMGEELLREPYTITGRIVKVDLGAMPDPPQLAFLVRSADGGTVDVSLAQRYGHRPETFTSACAMVTAAFESEEIVFVRWVVMPDGHNSVRTIILRKHPPFDP